MSVEISFLWQDLPEYLQVPKPANINQAVENIIDRNFNSRFQRYRDFCVWLGIPFHPLLSPDGDNIILSFAGGNLKMRGIGNSGFSVEKCIQLLQEKLTQDGKKITEIEIIHFQNTGKINIVYKNIWSLQTTSTGMIEIPEWEDISHENMFETVSEQEVFQKYQMVREILLNSRIKFQGYEIQNSVGYHFHFKWKEYYIEGLDQCPIDMRAFASRLSFYVSQKWIDMLDISSLEFSFSNMWMCKVLYDNQILPFSFLVPLREICSPETSSEPQK